MRGYNQEYYIKHKEKLLARSRAWYAANRERQHKKIAEYYATNRERLRWRKIQMQYGLSREQYDTLFIQQQGRCAICDKGEIMLAVDHDHTSGAIRGLLCTACNTFLGRYEKLREPTENYLRRRYSK